MKAVAFADDGDTGTVEFADWPQDTQASLWRRMRDWIIGEKGQEIADQVIPDYAINALRDAARSEPTPSSTLISSLPPSFSEQENTVTAEEETAAARMKADNQRLAAELATERAEKSARSDRTSGAQRRVC